MNSAKSVFWLLLVLASIGMAGTAWAQSNGGIEIGGGSEECDGNDDCGDVGGGSDDLDGNCPSCFHTFVEGFEDDIDKLASDIADAIGHGAWAEDNHVHFGGALPYPYYCTWENTQEIEFIGIEVTALAQSPRSAKIRKLTLGTNGGKVITVTLNGVSTAIRTEEYSPGIGAYNVNAALNYALVLNGFSVTETIDYLIVTHHGGILTDFTQLSIDVEDSGIKTAEIALEPNTNNDTLCPWIPGPAL